MDEIENLINMFDDLLVQTIRFGLSHDELKQGKRADSFQQVLEWKQQFGYKFNIYGNDHLVNGKAHFHFDNMGTGLSAKIDFDGNVLEINGSIPSNVRKELTHFLSNDYIQKRLRKIWNEKNPNLIVS